MRDNSQSCVELDFAGHDVDCSGEACAVEEETSVYCTEAGICRENS